MLSEAQKRAKKKHYRKHPESGLLEGARRRSKLKGLPCTIVKEDIVIPDRCPVLGLELVTGKGRQLPNSPSIDRIFPSLGYVPENIVVISWRANQLKRDASMIEMELIYKFYKELLKNELRI